MINIICEHYTEFKILLDFRELIIACTIMNFNIKLYINL